MTSLNKGVQTKSWILEGNKMEKKIITKIIVRILIFILCMVIIKGFEIILNIKLFSLYNVCNFQ